MSAILTQSTRRSARLIGRPCKGAALKQPFFGNEIDGLSLRQAAARRWPEKQKRR
jgi:hypothetical protein